MHRENNIKNKYQKNIYLYISIICLLVLSNIISILHIFYQNKEYIASAYPYIDFSRNFLDKKDYVTNIQPLRNSIRELTQNYKNGDVSVYIEFLNTGANISINPDTYIFPASLLKLPIAITALKKVEKGEWHLDNELVLMEEDKNDDSGNVSDLLARDTTGTRYSIETLLGYSLRDSDNTAFNILYRNLSDEEIQEFVDSIGLDKISDQEGKVSAKEYSRMLRSLYTASFLNRENSQKILEWLDESTFTDFLASGVPEDVRFPHKYGENLHQKVFSDSGIVYIANRPYIISVMLSINDAKVTEEKGIEDARKFMHEVSKLSYDYFSSYNK